MVRYLLFVLAVCFFLPDMAVGQGTTSPAGQCAAALSGCDAYVGSRPPDSFWKYRCRNYASGSQLVVQGCAYYDGAGSSYCSIIWEQRCDMSTACGAGYTYQPADRLCHSNCEPPQVNDSATGQCVTPPTCDVGMHWPGTGNICIQDTCSANQMWVSGQGCIDKPSCGAGYHDDGSGQCVQDVCANNQHYVQGQGCVANPTCDIGYHNDLANNGTCVKDQCTLGKVWKEGQGCIDPPPVQCTTGFHDNGHGVCIPDADCNVNPTATGCSPPPFCKQHPDDPFCVSPPPFCKDHPDDPTCKAPEPFCKQFPNDPVCKAPNPFCKDHPDDPSCKAPNPFCKDHPDDPACKSPDPYCKLHPDDPACKSPNPYCVDHPDDPWCKSQTDPPKPYCVDHPNDPWCKSQTNPPNPYCVDHPVDPYCKALVDPPKPPTGDSPEPWCKSHQDDPACQAPAPYCKLHPDDPACASQQPGQGSDMCKDHPDAAACQTNHASGGGDCNSPPQCSGDQTQCAILYQAWSARCAAGESSQGGLTDLYTKSGDTVDSIMARYKVQLESTPLITAASHFLSLNVSGSCPSFTVPSAEIFGVNIWAGLDGNFLCNGTLDAILDLAAYVVMFLAAYEAFRIAFL